MRVGRAHAAPHRRLCRARGQGAGGALRASWHTASQRQAGASEVHLHAARPARPLASQPPLPRCRATPRCGLPNTCRRTGTPSWWPAATAAWRFTSTDTQTNGALGRHRLGGPRPGAVLGRGATLALPPPPGAGWWWTSALESGRAWRAAQSQCAIAPSPASLWRRLIGAPTRRACLWRRPLTRRCGWAWSAARPHCDGCESWAPETVSPDPSHLDCASLCGVPSHVSHMSSAQ